MVHLIEDWIIEQELRKLKNDNREQLQIPLYTPPQNPPKIEENEEKEHKITIYIR